MEHSVHVIDDFLSTEETQYLLEMVIKHSGYDPKPLFEGTGLIQSDALEEGMYPNGLDPEKTLLKVVNKVGEYYLSTHEMHGELVFNRAFGVTMFEGAELPAHRDEDPNSEGQFDGKKRSHVCSVILNDDYEGGGLVFPDQNISMTPKAGSMVLFPGYYVAHGVDKILKGTRRVLLVFFYDVMP